MTILSIVIAGISLFISILSLIYVKHAYQNNRQTSIANLLDKYGEELYKIQNITSKEIEELKTEASLAHQDIGKLFDKFSNSTYGGRPARHILGDLFDEIFKDFIPSIGSNSISIWDKLQIVLNFDEDYYRPEHKCFYPNQKAKNIYAILLSMIPETEYDNLIKNVVDSSTSYYEKHKVLIPVLEESINKLDDLIKRNEHETFKLSESEAGQKLLAENKKYNNLKEIGLEDAFSFIKKDKNKPRTWEVREAIYIYSALVLISQYNYWNEIPEN